MIVKEVVKHTHQVTASEGDDCVSIVMRITTRLLASTLCVAKKELLTVSVHIFSVCRLLHFIGLGKSILSSTLSYYYSHLFFYSSLLSFSLLSSSLSPHLFTSLLMSSLPYTLHFTHFVFFNVIFQGLDCFAD